MLEYLETQQNLQSFKSQGTDQFSLDENLAGTNVVDDGVSGFGPDPSSL